MPQTSDPTTRRPIDLGSAILEPADRALLDLWVNHGLDDERLCALTRMSSSAMHARRARIIMQLSWHLAVPAADVLAALQAGELPEPRLPAPAEATLPAGQLPQPTRAAPAQAVPGPPAHAAPGPSAPARGASPAQAEVDPPPPAVVRAGRSSGRPRSPWTRPIAAVGTIGAVIAAVLILSSGGPASLAHNAAAGDTGTHTAAAADTRAAAAGDTGAQAPGGFTPSAQARFHLPQQLAPAYGSARLTGAGAARRIEINVHGLTAAPRGRYEVWFSSSAQDMQRLGRVRAQTGSASYRLPPDASRFHWIDVTFQPSGATGDDGVVVLRAKNPAILPTAGASEDTQLAEPSPSWSDEFDGNSLDTGNWTINTGGGGHGNGDLEDYAPANVSVSGGDLRLTAESNGSTITSGSIQSLGKISAQYGLIEASIEVPKGVGLWPAFWMQGTDTTTVGWPRDGEIDVMEILANDYASNNGSLHTYSSSASQFQHTTVERCSCDLSAGFHTYAIDWSPGQVQFMLDGKVYGTETKAQVEAGGGTWTFGSPFFFILNLAVGGSGNGNPDSSTPFPATMKVDWVRVYPNF